jgi:sec-independent protein translocase protein TatB
MDFLGIGVGLPQLLLVLIVAMLVLGPERLPEVARQLARGIRTLRGYADEVQGQFQGEIGGLREEFLDIQRDLSSIQGNLRSGLLELDSTVQSVHSEVNSAVSGSALALNATLGLPTGSEPAVEPAARTVDYVPAPPRALSRWPLADEQPSAERTMSADGRLPDYTPPV